MEGVFLSGKGARRPAAARVQMLNENIKRLHQNLQYSAEMRAQGA